MVAPTPEADEVFRSFEGGSQASGLGEYLAGELSAAAVDRFFVAARVLFALAPWKSLDDSMLIRVDSEVLGLEGACISILGHQLEHRGFLILPSVADYDRLPDHGRPGPSMNGIAMSFDSRDEVAPEMLLEIEANGWPVASEDAYPVPMRIVEGCHAPVTDPELRVLTACCNALTGLIARSGLDAVADAATDQGAPICISFSDSEGVVTRLTVPPEAADLFDVDDTVGLVRVGDGVLKVETNSIEQADRLRTQLEADCGGLIQHRLRSHTDPLSTVLPAGDTAPPRPQGPEIDKIVRQHKEQHYSTWPDEPIPALDGETPRAAVRTKAGRERVEVLIKDLERAESREPPGMRYDTTPLRRELGLDTDTL